MAMKVVGLEWRRVRVPLRKAIKHASHARAESENLIVSARLDNGAVGYGEGVPRPYVTGETLETAFEMLRGWDLARQLGEPSSFEEAVDRLADLETPARAADPRGAFGNAARCALEMALLEAFARGFDRSIGEALVRMAPPEAGLRSQATAVRYSGAITAEGAWAERISAWKMRLYGFHQVKIKVGVAGQDDPARLRRFRRILGTSRDLRIDANEAWDASEAEARAQALVPFGPTALEQPLPHAQVETLAELRPRLGIPVMLDESLCGWGDAVKAVELGLTDLFNVRLSKCGGIGPSLALIGLAKRSGLGVQLGCHPGETGLLSAAGRQVASRIAEPRYLEGSYDRHVRAENPIRGDITFGYGGRAGPLEGPGWGVEVDSETLERMTLDRESW